MGEFMRMQKKLRRPRRPSVRLAKTQLTPEQADALRSIARQAEPIRVSWWPVLLILGVPVLALLVLLAIALL